MKGRFLSREFSACRVIKSFAVAGICLAGLVLALYAGSYIKHAWYDPWRSAQILQTLNEKTQTIDEQLRILNQAVVLDYHNVDARYWFARKLTEKKEYNHAAGHWAYVGKWHVGGIRDLAFADQGMCLLFSNQQAKAIICLQEAIRRRPEHVTSRVFLAAAYADLGLARRVEEELVMLANLKPNWQLPFETCPEWSVERKAAIKKLKPYLDSLTVMQQ